jgi:hypothetical protein
VESYIQDLIAAGLSEEKARELAYKAGDLNKGGDIPADKLVKSMDELRTAFATHARVEVEAAVGEELATLEKAYGEAQATAETISGLADGVTEIFAEAADYQNAASYRIEAKLDALCKALEVIGDEVEELRDGNDLTGIREGLNDVQTALRIPLRKSIATGVELIPSPAEGGGAPAPQDSGMIRKALRDAAMAELPTADIVRKQALTKAINLANVRTADPLAIAQHYNIKVGA